MKKSFSNAYKSTSVILLAFLAVVSHINDLHDFYENFYPTTTKMTIWEIISKLAEFGFYACIVYIVYKTSKVDEYKQENAKIFIENQRILDVLKAQQPQHKINSVLIVNFSEYILETIDEDRRNDVYKDLFDVYGFGYEELRKFGFSDKFVAEYKRQYHLREIK